MAKQKQMRRVKPFTPEQGAILKFIMETPKILATTVQVHLLALRNLLVRKELITHEEFDDAFKETRAQLMVELALSPEIQMLEEKMRQILERLGLAEEA